MRAKYRTFGLVLMVTHACTLRCRYCYTGAKLDRSMPRTVGERSLERALASILPGGTLELGFFGGEPLLEASLVRELLTCARALCQRGGILLRADVTTSGTVTDDHAWAVLSEPDVEVAISCDGRPQTHDRHRRFSRGRGSATEVVTTIERLVATSRDFRVIMVVRPDNLAELAAGAAFLIDRGVPAIAPSIDLWCEWTDEDIAALDTSVRELAQVWRSTLPKVSVSWFDEKIGRLTAAARTYESARCGFGLGEIAVAPSGNLYPCERLIADDRPDNPHRLPGHALAGSDFLDTIRTEDVAPESCEPCAVRSFCSTACPCSNVIRTGRPHQPDRLLCLLNQFCLREASGALETFVHKSSKEIHVTT